MCQVISWSIYRGRNETQRVEVTCPWARGQNVNPTLATTNVHWAPALPAQGGFEQTLWNVLFFDSPPPSSLSLGWAEAREASFFSPGEVPRLLWAKSFVIRVEPTSPFHVHPTPTLIPPLAICLSSTVSSRPLLLRSHVLFFLFRS